MTNSIRRIANMRHFIILLTLAATALSLLGQSQSPAPAIGLVFNSEQAAEEAGGTPRLATYRNAIESNGGRIVVLSPLLDAKTLRERLAGLDGLLIPGGDDINPAHYGEKPDPRLELADLTLDALELDLLDYARKHRLPVLGICRGFQLINVFMGGSLYQDLPTGYRSGTPVVHRRDTGGGAPAARHVISLDPGSRLARILGESSLEVNSYHHQGVKKTGKGLLVNARGEDGLVEAFQGKDARWYLLAVQFHPEKDLDRAPRLHKIFRDFLAAAQSFRSSGQGS